MKQRRVSNRSASDADYYLTTIEKIPGGIAPQRLRDFLQFSKNLSKTHKPTGPQWFLI